MGRLANIFYWLGIKEIDKREQDSPSAKMPPLKIYTGKSCSFKKILAKNNDFLKFSCQFLVESRPFVKC